MKVSEDQGKTWNVNRVLHAGPAAYSTLVELRDGSVAVLYECGETSPYSKITFARFPLVF
jgi:sialidase-1